MHWSLKGGVNMLLIALEARVWTYVGSRTILTNVLREPRVGAHHETPTYVIWDSQEDRDLQRSNLYAYFAHMGFGELFHGMPPVGLHQSVRMFRPEYSVLVLADKLVLDEATFDLLQERRGLYTDPYRLVAETIIVLHEEGFIELQNYSHVLDKNAELLHNMIEIDFQSSKQWEQAFESSLTIWRRFAEKIRDESLGAPTVSSAEEIFEFLTGLVRRPPSRGFRGERPGKEVLRQYLRYVNANIVLANELSDGAFHDWADFLPFYRRKFLSVGREDAPSAALQEASQELFEVVVPEFLIQSPKQLIEILRHRRVGELRQLIEEAAQGNVTFDGEFARSVLREVADTSERITKYSKIVSYITLPVSLIPIPEVGPQAGAIIQQALNEMVNAAIAAKLKRKYRWFYMLRDITRG
jgi:hypothetical protein